MELKIDIQYEQLLTLIKQLPAAKILQLKSDLSDSFIDEKAKSELHKEAIDTKFSQLLQTFQTNELSEECIDKEVETVRQELYEHRKKQ